METPLDQHHTGLRQVEVYGDTIGLRQVEVYGDTIGPISHWIEAVD